MILSTSLITLALIFYSLGVWAERVAGYLKGSYLGAFWIGSVFYVSGTLAMGIMSDNPFDLTDMHILTGQMALWLILAHASWATMVVLRGTEKNRMEFHNYSILVWMMWLIPYIGSMWMGMAQ